MGVSRKSEFYLPLASNRYGHESQFLAPDAPGFASGLSKKLVPRAGVLLTQVAYANRIGKIIP
jgi:hypothetical protein